MRSCKINDGVLDDSGEQVYNPKQDMETLWAPVVFTL